MPGGHELLPVPAPHDEGALLAGGDDHARLVRRDRREGVVAAQAAVGEPHRLGEPVGLELVRDQVGDHLGVGLRR